jgi:hypothetical protein
LKQPHLANDSRAHDVTARAFGLVQRFSEPLQVGRKQNTWRLIAIDAHLQIEFPSGLTVNTFR